MNTRNQHTGTRVCQPCPIARRRRKTIARQTMGSVGMTGGFRCAQQGVTMA